MCGERHFIRVLVPQIVRDQVTRELRAFGKDIWVTWVVLVNDIGSREYLIVTYDLAADPSIDFSTIKEVQVSFLTSLDRVRGHIDLARLKGVPISQTDYSDIRCVCQFCGKEGLFRAAGKEIRYTPNGWVEVDNNPDEIHIFECLEHGDYYWRNPNR